MTSSAEAPARSVAHAPRWQAIEPLDRESLARAHAEALNLVQWPARIANSFVAGGTPEERIPLEFRAADAALAGLPMMAPMPPAVAESVAGYVELARKFTPQGAHYLENHRGHLMFVKPEERPFLTADLIRATSMTATEREIRERIATLGDAGYTQFTVQLIPGQEAAIADWARIKAAFS